MHWPKGEIKIREIRFFTIYIAFALLFIKYNYNILITIPIKKRCMSMTYITADESFLVLLYGIGMMCAVAQFKFMLTLAPDLTNNE